MREFALRTGNEISEATLELEPATPTKEEKIAKIAFHFSHIMETLGLDLSDDSLMNTPNRVAKMYVNELFSGLDPKSKPAISLFANTYGYHNMLVEKDITFYSTCEHHFLPIIGKVHVAYIPGNFVLGLSKINRLVQYYAKRPQVQERLTVQIRKGLQEILEHDNVAILIAADHLCVSCRGIKDTNSSTTTSSFGGAFQNTKLQQEFLGHIYNRK